MKIEIDDLCQDLLSPGALTQVKKALSRGVCEKCLSYTKEQRDKIRELIAYPDHTVIINNITYYASCNIEKQRIYLDMTITINEKTNKKILLLFHSISEWEIFWARFIKGY